MTHETQRAQKTIAKGKKDLTKKAFGVMSSLLKCALRIRGVQYSGEGEFYRMALCEPSHTYFDAERIVNVFECELEDAHNALHFLAEEGYLCEGQCGGCYVYSFR